jgi:ABC-2 type transport system permease protein
MKVTTNRTPEVFRSVYTKTLRDMRWGTLSWGLGLGALALVTALGWSIAYPDEASRQQLAAQIKGGLAAAQVFYGRPVGIDQVGGFVEWRTLGLSPVLLGLYAILAGTGMTRGAEESGAIEVVVATSTSRTRVLLEQAAALVTALFAALSIVGVCLLAAGIVSGETGPPVGRIIEACLNVFAAAAFFGALGLLTAQFALRRRNAVLAASGLMAVAHLANTFPLAVPAINWARYGSPLALYSRSSPLADGHMDWFAWGALVVLACGTLVLAVVASSRRDLFSVLRIRPPERHDLDSLAPRRIRRELLLHNSFQHGIRDLTGTTIAWAFGLGLLAVLMTALTPNMRDAILEQSTSEFARRLKEAGMISEKGILSLLLFSFVPPLFGIFAVNLAASWAGDEVRGRLELELATPVRRWSVFLQRFGSALVAQLAAVAVVAIASVATIKALEIEVPVLPLLAALAVLWALTAAIVAVGFASASWRPRSVTGLMGGFVAISYFAGLVIPLLDLPHWVIDFSVFGLYGSPLLDGVEAWRVVTLLALTAVFAAVGAIAFQRKDIAR